MKSKLFKIIALLMAVTFIGAGVAICGCSSPTDNPPESIEGPGDEDTTDNPDEETGGEETPDTPDEEDKPDGGLINGGIFEGH